MEPIATWLVLRRLPVNGRFKLIKAITPFPKQLTIEIAIHPPETGYYQVRTTGAHCSEWAALKEENYNNGSLQNINF